MIQCATQGRGHKRTNTPCQDKTYCLNCDGVYVIALADGAGSAQFSHFGAECASKHISNLLCSKFEAFFSSDNGMEVKNEIVISVLDALEKNKPCQDCELKDLASTLLAVAIKDDRFIILHIGDGVIGYLENNTLKVASYPTNGEYSNTTYFTTSSTVLQHMSIMRGKLEDIMGFVLMSDGSAESLFHKKTATFAPVLKKIMRYCVIMSKEKAESLLLDAFENSVSKKTFDDCSITLIVNKNLLPDDITILPENTRYEFLQIPQGKTGSSHRLHKYEKILKELTEPLDVNSLSRKIHLKPKYTKNRLDYLEKLGLIERTGQFYQSLLKN